MKYTNIGFIVNPIAGMGGRVGLKGTDDVVDKARKLGAKPISPKKSLEMLEELISLYSNKIKNIPIKWHTCSGKMGADFLKKKSIKNFETIYKSQGEKTTLDDTKTACKKFIESKAELILFCGGDGTARDIFNIVDKKVPILGIPSGVKMHSGVFGINVKASARILKEFVERQLTIGDAEIMDLDEELYRQGVWKVRLFGTALGIVEPEYVQVGKAVFEAVSDETIKDELAEHIIDQMKEELDYLYLLGSGSTVNHVGKKLGLNTTVLGIDAVVNKKLVGKDLNEQGILKLIKQYSKVKIVLSPIGAQGFILGRGNLQLSPTVIRKVGIDNLIIISTPSKLRATPVIRVDSGDNELDHLFAEKEYLMVVIGYRLMRVTKLQTNKF